MLKSISATCERFRINRLLASRSGPVAMEVQPSATDSTCGRSVSGHWSGPQLPAHALVPSIEAHTPAEHAAALLAWLQGPGGRTGTITANELVLMHIDMCTTRDWELIGWVGVARELRRLIGARKEYARADGHRSRVYRIPPRIKRTLQLAAYGLS